MAQHDSAQLRKVAGVRTGRRLFLTTCLLAIAVAVQLGQGGRAGATPGTWSATGPLNTNRSAHTATLLPSGKVLVVGGGTPSAELYDPATGTWVATGSMRFSRQSHTATLLANGRVLVAGGFSTDQGQGAELYDPNTGTWTLTGAMAVSRYDHTATILPDGTVLVAGGEFFFTPSPAAEIYDPVTGTWSSTGPMTVRRTEHAAALLSQAPCGDLCGKVLITGGQVEPNPTQSATTATNATEVFDPATRTWSTMNAFDIARSNHTATVLENGGVLLAGGSNGNPGGPATASAQLFDPVARSWSATGPLAAARFGHTATGLPSGEVLVAGGSGPLAAAELYNPATGTWSTAGTMATGRVGHTANLLETNEVLVAGGSDDASAELYGPALPVLSVGDVTVHEGDAGTRTASFTVALSEPAAREITVAYATADADGIAPTDYTAKAGTLAFAPGTASLTVKVPVAGDKVDEPVETFTVGLSSPFGATLGQDTGTGTIVDDDPAAVPGVRVAVGDVTVHEGDAGARAAVFSVSLSKASTSYTTVSYTTAKGTASGKDFTTKTGTLRFSPGTTSLAVKVSVTPDTLAEDDEKFAVSLSTASGATIADATGQGTIVDNE